MKYLTPFFLLLTIQTSFAQLQIPLWPNGAPGFEDRKDEKEQISANGWISNIHNPSITAYLPDKDKANGTAVIICPGGGHRRLSFNAEGVDAAKFLNELGIAAFVLKHRLFREEGSPYTLEKHVRQDAYRAMRLVNSQADEWGLDTAKIGIMGFSAGGETVAMIAYQPGFDPQANGPIDRLNGLPDFQILVYPGPLGVPDEVPSYAPAAFMVVANNDECCSQTVAQLIDKYRKTSIPMEAHVFAYGDHAFVMGGRTQLKTVGSWSNLLAHWLFDSNLTTLTVQK